MRNNDKKKIGKVKKREIRTSDESIINEILSANRSDEYKPGKTLYTIKSSELIMDMNPDSKKTLVLVWTVNDASSESGVGISKTYNSY